MSYHVNPETGNVGRCRAQQGKCPFGSPESHFPTKEGAARAWESKQKSNLPTPVKTIVLSDIDGTLLKESLVLSNAIRLHEEGVMDLGDLPARWKADMKNEELIRDLAEAYREALAGRTVAFVKAKDHVNALLASDENFYTALQRLVAAKEAGHEVVLISGSPDFLVGPFARHFGFKYHASKYHKDRQGRFTGKITLMAGAPAKEAVIRDLGVEDYDHVIGLGDTASDGPLLDAAHHAVLVAPTDDTLEALRAKGIRVDEVLHA